MDPKKVKLSGQVARELVSPGSKSEHRAVVLHADDGNSYVLRRTDGPSFGDAELDKLVGGRISTQGVLAGRTLIMRQWKQQ